MTHLLATKFHKPSLVGQRVQRPQLIQHLNEGLAAGRQLTLVSAPAGFGKTICVSEWVNSLSRKTAWLSLDKSDDDLGRFLMYWLAALQRVDANIGKDVDGILQSGQLPSLEGMVTTLVNDISQVREPFLLVLDDFHVIQDDAILRALGMFINNQPEQMHLVLTTREDPLLPLARLRANNQMTEVRAGDLRFSGSEAGQFLNEIMGLSLSDRDILNLENRTEGWAVGLQLAGLSMRDRKDPSRFIAGLNGSHRFILSYLTEEVLNLQPVETQDFLLQTSILDKLNGDLCDAVTCRAGSGDLLEKLFNANLFLISLDDEQQWYRYHHLFADLLRSQLSRLHKEMVAPLRQRASLWYEQAGMPGEAIEQALAAADYPRVNSLLEKNARRMIMQGYAITVEKWTQSVPQPWSFQSPQINLAFAWMHLQRGSYEKIPAYLQQVEAAITAMQSDPKDTAALRAEWLAAQSTYLNVLGKPAESIEKANQALLLMKPEDHFLKGLAYLGMGGAYRYSGDYPRLCEAYQNAIFHSRIALNPLPEIMGVSALTLTAIQWGKLHFAVEVGSQMDETASPIAATVLGSMGVVYYQWNQIEKARGLFLRAAQLSQLSGHNAGMIFSKVLLSKILFSEGNLDAAGKTLEEAVSLLPAGVPAWVKPEVASQQVYFLLATHQYAAAEDVLKQYGMWDGEKCVFPERWLYSEELFYVSCLRLILYQLQTGSGPVDVQQWLENADGLIARANEAQRMGVVLQLVVLRALMKFALGNTAASLADLSGALELARPEGYVRIFVDEAQPMADLLQLALESDVQTEYVMQLLAAFPERKTERQLPVPSSNELSEPLTERELEVLRLIAEGLKYEEIAGRLVITLNTVRFYVKEIYGKLGVNNRTRAVETGRSLHLL